MPDFSDLQRLAAEILGVDPARVTPDVSFARDLAADSLDLVDLIAAVEDEFHTKLGDELLATMRNAGDLWRYLQARQAPALEV